MKLSSIEALVAVIKAGSIHAAARELGISQPALSKGLRALEEELAAPLLIRSSAGVEPTDYGRAYSRRARIAIDELRKAREDLMQLRGTLEGRLTVAIAPASTMQLAPMVFSDFRRVCPDVELHIVEGIWPAVAEPLRDGSVDLAIGPVLDDQPRSELAIEPLLDVEMAVVVRRSHPLAAVRSIRELSAGRWLHQGAGGSSSILIRRLFAELKLPVPPVSVESRSLTATLMLLQTMDLIALLPRAMVEMAHLRDTLVALDLKEPLRPNAVGLLHRADRPLTQVGQIFVTHARRAAQHLARRARAPTARPAAR